MEVLTWGGLPFERVQTGNQRLMLILQQQYSTFDTEVRRLLLLRHHGGLTLPYVTTKPETVVIRGSFADLASP